MKQKRIDAGYSIAVTHDDCGCQIVFNVLGFDGLTKSIDDDLNITVVFDSDPYSITRLIARAELPDGVPKQSLATFTAEYVEIPEGELYDWAYARLHRHHSRSYTRTELEFVLVQHRLDELVAESAQKFCEHVTSINKQLRDHRNGIAGLVDKLRESGANPVATDHGGFTLIHMG